MTVSRSTFLRQPVHAGGDVVPIGLAREDSYFRFPFAPHVSWRSDFHSSRRTAGIVVI